MFFLPGRIADQLSYTLATPGIVEPTEKAPVAPTLTSRAVKACLSHAGRDFTGQALGRLLGLGVYSLLSTLGETPLRIASGIAGAGAGARLSYLIASQQIGTDSHAQRAAVGACTVVGTLIGGVIAGVGSNQIVAGLAAGSLVTAAVSASSKWATSADEKSTVNELKSGAAIGVMYAGIGVAAWIDYQWKVGSHLLPTRNLGLVVESTVIEICKSSFERFGPSVNRNVLTFEGKALAAVLGMAPYVAATVLLNGYVSSLMQQDHDSPSFGELAAPMIVGAIANAVRGGVNALVVVELHSKGLFVADEDSTSLRDHAGAQWPEPESVVNKSCIRLLLSACRNAVYARLRDHGMSIGQASEIAQGVYACYAQCRDLIHDVARGEGWAEPTLTPRKEIASA